MIYRGLNYDSIARTREVVDTQAQSFLQTGHERKFFILYLPAMACAQPSGYTAPEFFGRCGITKYGMIKAVAQGVDYRRTGLEIHVGNPEGKQVVTAELKVHFLEFCSVCIVAVYHAIEIVFFFTHDVAKLVIFTEIAKPVSASKTDAHKYMNPQQGAVVLMMLNTLLNT